MFWRCQVNVSNQKKWEKQLQRSSILLSVDYWAPTWLKMTLFQTWNFGGKNHFVTALFPLIKAGSDNLFPQIHLCNANAFLEDLTGKYFYNLAYKLQFLHFDFQTLHKWACFSTTVLPFWIYVECCPMQYIIKNATVKFVIFYQQPSSHDLCVNIAHTRSKIFRCVRKYIKFVIVSFQVLIKWYRLRS